MQEEKAEERERRKEKKSHTIEHSNNINSDNYQE